MPLSRWRGADGGGVMARGSGCGFAEAAGGDARRADADRHAGHAAADLERAHVLDRGARVEQPDAFRGEAFMARIAGVVLDERHAEPIRLAQAADGDVGRGGIDDAAGFGGESLAGLGEQRVLSESQKQGEHDLSPIRDGPIRSSSRG
ncbi:hypothetical protein SPHINGOT1_110010 [Sphingomonas sp. T1]|nr:hypothetical protein SPHINGOT1_110010 [Sphingomonas sp. T1]